ncbi:methyl-accepting chemotaxis protein [Rhizobium flavum]|uniref:Methyl-accepting chemotaxis protein n=1 Tax=Pseudorhizobium flavum TaxID=1335061 RepID=A0A7X0DDS1_9HYPH|nr:methyl-accepting chemotaxis protein [Pseudorhizobium flavum]
MTRILVAASVVVVVALAGFSFHINSIQHASVTKSVQDSISSAGRQASQALANWMNGRVVLTNMVADAVSRNPDAVTAVLDNQVLTKEFSSTYFGDTAGTFTMWPDLPMPADYDPRQRPWYKDAVASGSVVLTEPYVDASSGDLVVSAAVPVNRKGALAGVVGSDFSLQSIVAMVKSIDLGVPATAFLVNKSGTVLIHPEASLVMKTLADVFPQETPATGATMVETTFGGRDVLVSFVPVAGLPSVEWYLGFAVDAEAAYASLTAFQTAAVIATVLAVAVMIGAMAWMLSRFVVRPVTDMTHAMERLAAGDLTVAIPGEDRRDQIGAMAAAVSVFRTNALERERLEGEAEEGRRLSDAERREREAQKAHDQAEAERAVKALAEALGALADGNLSHRIEVPFAAHIDRLRTDYNAAVTQLKSALQAVGSNARTIDAGAEEIRVAADGLARRTEQQAASVEETAAALEEITTTVRDTAHRAEEVGTLVSRARDGAEHSGAVVSKAVAAMTEIEDSSGKISNIIGVIDDIAFQTTCWHSTPAWKRHVQARQARVSPSSPRRSVNSPSVLPRPQRKSRRSSRPRTPRCVQA